MVHVDTQRDKTSFHGTLDLYTGRETVTESTVLNGVRTAEHLEQVLATYPEQPILLLWDRAPWYYGNAIRNVLVANPRLEVVYFPAAAPDLNPQVSVTGLYWARDVETAQSTFARGPGGYVGAVAIRLRPRVARLARFTGALSAAAFFWQAATIKAPSMDCSLRRLKWGAWVWRKARPALSAPLFVASHRGLRRNGLRRSKCSSVIWSNSRRNGGSARYAGLVRHAS